MFIPPITCPACSRTARPGEEGFQDSNTEIHCACGQTIPDASVDQRILSTNIFARLGATANHVQYGSVAFPVGRSLDVTFSDPFEVVPVPFLTPQAPILVGTKHVGPKGMLVLSSAAGSEKLGDDPVRVSWLAFGLRDVASLPTWWIIFFGAVTHAMNGLYKAALLDYAAAFEAFLEQILRQKLKAKFGPELAEYLLRRAWRIEERAKDLLELATGHRLAERDDVYQPWLRDVKEPRDHLIHGKPLSVSEKHSEAAHSASFQAIRWTESVA